MNSISTQRDLAEWTLKASPGAKRHIVTFVTPGNLPKTLGAFVQMLDHAGVIRAFWQASHGEEGQRIWTWNLHRTGKKVTRQRLQDLAYQSNLELSDREKALDQL